MALVLFCYSLPTFLCKTSAYSVSSYNLTSVFNPTISHGQKDCCQSCYCSQKACCQKGCCHKAKERSRTRRFNPQRSQCDAEWLEVQKLGWPFGLAEKCFLIWGFGAHPTKTYSETPFFYRRKVGEQRQGRTWPRDKTKKATTKNKAKKKNLQQAKHRKNSFSPSGATSSNETFLDPFWVLCVANVYRKWTCCRQALTSQAIEDCEPLVALETFVVLRKRQASVKSLMR